MTFRTVTADLVSWPTLVEPGPRTPVAHWLPLMLALVLAVFGVGCKDDDGGGGSVEGVFVSDAAPAPASAPSPGVAQTPCELGLDTFALVEQDESIALLHGIGATGGGVIPGTLTDDDMIVFGFLLLDDGLGNTVSIDGTLDVLAGGKRVAGTLRMEISGGLGADDCGPTLIDVAADRDTRALPAPAPALSTAGGAWDVFVNPISQTLACEMNSVQELLAAEIVMDQPEVGMAVIDLEEGEQVIEADLIDHYFISSFVEDGESTLLVLQYRPVNGPIQDFLTGVVITAMDTETGLCTYVDELAGTRSAGL